MAEHYFANDGSDWTTPPSPVSSKEARAADEKLDKTASKGDGPSATNEVRPQHTIVEGSEGTNATAEKGTSRRSTRKRAEGRGANGA